MSGGTFNTRSTESLVAFSGGRKRSKEELIEPDSVRMTGSLLQPARMTGATTNERIESC
jgi:hypothetical protein